MYKVEVSLKEQTVDSLVIEKRSFEVSEGFWNSFKVQSVINSVDNKGGLDIFKFNGPIVIGGYQKESTYIMTVLETPEIDKDFYNNGRLIKKGCPLDLQKRQELRKIYFDQFCINMLKKRGVKEL